MRPPTAGSSFCLTHNFLCLCVFPRLVFPGLVLRFLHSFIVPYIDLVFCRSFLTFSSAAESSLPSYTSFFNTKHQSFTGHHYFSTFLLPSSYTFILLFFIQHILLPYFLPTIPLLLTSSLISKSDLQLLTFDEIFLTDIC